MRPAKFLLTNLSGTLVDTGVLAALSRVFESYWSLYLAAPVIAFQVSVLNNFTLAYLWVWQDRVSRTRSDYWKRLLQYGASAAAVFAVRLAVIASLGALFRLDVVLCNLAALALSGLLAFGAQDRIVFRSG